MKPEKTVDELLHWRFSQARVEAPSAPSASQLLDRARPWWEKWPEMFQSKVKRLRRIQIGHDGPATDPSRSSDGNVVPTLIVCGAEESEGLVRVLEFNIRKDNLRFRFQIEPRLTLAESTLELTFISDTDARPLLFAPAIGLMESEYLLDAALLPEIARDWARLKKTDRLPFRFIFRSGTGN